MKGASFCIHRTCLCHWVFELPLSHLSQCTAIHFIFITLACWMPLFPPQLRLYRPRVKLKMLRVNYVLSSMSDVAISEDQQLLSHLFFYHLKASFLVLIMPVLTDVSFDWYVSPAKPFLSLCFPQFHHPFMRLKAMASVWAAYHCYDAKQLPCLLQHLSGTKVKKGEQGSIV